LKRQRLGVKEGVDGVVGVGGEAPSIRKGGKNAANPSASPASILRRVGVVTKPSVPLIVIPTNRRNGSECTPGGVITDTEKNIKTTYRE
jgi:alcohol dehydrogenase class IV